MIKNFIVSRLIVHLAFKCTYFYSWAWVRWIVLWDACLCYTIGLQVSWPNCIQMTLDIIMLNNIFPLHIKTQHYHFKYLKCYANTL